jgi:hypothetical protein
MTAPLAGSSEAYDDSLPKATSAVRKLRLRYVPTLIMTFIADGVENSETQPHDSLKSHVQGHVALREDP